MFCTKCGKEYKEGQRFCTGCGNKLDPTFTPQQQTLTEQPATPAQSGQPVVLPLTNGRQTVQPQFSAQPQQPPQNNKNNRKLLIIILVVIFVALIGCSILAYVLLNGNKPNAADKDRDTEETQEETESFKDDSKVEDTEPETMTEEPETATEEMPVTEEPETQEPPYTADEAEWKKAYYDFVIGNEDLQYIYQDERDQVNFYLIYIEDNDVPELYMDSLNGSIGDMVATYHGAVDYMMYIGPYGACEYVEGSGRFANSDGRMGYYTDTIYKIENGVITIADGGTWTEDVNPDNPDELLHNYSWNGETVDESTYYTYKNQAYDYAQSRYCNSTSQAMTFDELIAYLNLENSSASAETETTDAITMLSNEYYYVDLDGDGNEEEIYCEVYTDFEDEYGCEVYVYVNDTCVIDVYRDSAIGVELSIHDFENHDSWKEICLSFHSDSDCFDAILAYRIENEVAGIYFDEEYDDLLIGRGGLDPVQPGDGTVCLDQEYYTQYLGQGYAHRIFRVEDQKWVQIPTNIYDVTAEWQEQDYHALIDLPVLADVASTEPAATIQTGELFHVQKLYTETEEGVLSGDICYIYVTSENGTSGWIKIPEEEFFEENEWRAWG